MGRLVLLAGTALLALLMALGGSPVRLGRSKDIATVGGQGYWLLGKDGGVFTYGDAIYLGNDNSGDDIVGIAPTPTLKGYWTADNDGTVFHYGDAHDYGSRVSLVKDISGFAARPQGDGYWLVTRAGIVTAKGGAAGHGNAPLLAAGHEIVGMASTPSGNGYWLVGRDGGIFSYGDAAFYGSTGAVRLNKPIVGMASTPSGHGYWFIASDGGVFSYGDAAFYGSTGANPPTNGVAGIAPTTTGHGYWLVAGNGKVFNFGDAVAKGDPSNLTLVQPVVAIAATPLVHTNEVPAAVADSASTLEDGSVTVDVLSNDAGLGDGPITVAVSSGPAHGTASVGSDKRITYSPAANYHGSDSLTYKVTDGDGEFSTATLSLTVTAVNDAPVAAGVSATATEDTPLTGTVHATDVDGDTLTYSVVASPAKGSLTFAAATGAYTYTPNADANGADSFTFKANDGTVDSNTATVAITVAVVNDAPVAVGTSLSLYEDGPATAGSVTATDAEADSLTFALDTPPTKGTAVVATDGTFTYTPDPNANGSDSFVVMVSDGHGGSGTASVSVDITAVNDNPVMAFTGGPTFTTNEDTPLVLPATVSDVETAANLLNVFAVPQDTDLVASAAFTGTGATRTLTVTPIANLFGTSKVFVGVTDVQGGFAGYFITVTILPVNDAPVFDGTGGSGAWVGLAPSFSASGTVHADDPGDTVTYTIEAGDEPLLGNASVDPNTGEWSVDTTFPGIPPTVTFTITATDSHGATDVILVTVLGI